MNNERLLQLERERYTKIYIEDKNKHIGAILEDIEDAKRILKKRQEILALDLSEEERAKAIEDIKFYTSDIEFLSNLYNQLVEEKKKDIILLEFSNDELILLRAATSDLLNTYAKEQPEDLETLDKIVALKDKLEKHLLYW